MAVSFAAKPSIRQQWAGGDAHQGIVPQLCARHMEGEGGGEIELAQGANESKDVKVFTFSIQRIVLQTFLLSQDGCFFLFGN